MKVGITVAAALLAAPAVARENGGDDQVAQGPTPGWVVASEPLAVPEKTSGLAFVRNQDTLVHLDAKGKSTYVGQRIVLLQPQALQLGNVAIAWNPASGKPTSTRFASTGATKRSTCCGPRSSRCCGARTSSSRRC